MRRHPYFLCVLALTVVLATLPTLLRAQETLPGSPRFSLLLTDKEAIGIIPGDIIVGQSVSQARWTPDGKNVVALRLPAELKPMAPPPSELSLVFWNSGTRRSRELWKRNFTSPVNTVQALTWLPGTQTCLTTLHWTEKVKAAGDNGKELLVDDFRQELLWVDLLKEQVREIPLRPFEAVYISPAQPYAVLHLAAYVEGRGQHALRVLKSDGSLGPDIPVPDRMQVGPVQWAKEGALLNLQLLKRLPEVKGLMAQWFTFNPATGEFRAMPDQKEPPAPFTPPPPKPGSAPLQVLPATSKFTLAETSATVRSLWLQSAVAGESGRALLCAEGEYGQVSPQGDSVLYVSQRAAWVSSLLRMPKEAYTKAKGAAERMVSLSKGKQIGLALMMWAQDHDEKLPGQDGVHDQIKPYLQNDSMLQGFTYLFTGGSLADIKAPAETLIGQVEGPGGRALIYADGHVKWKDY